jgi:MoxR-like ATPase
MVIATQNPIEQEGTYRLPEAQLDRFLFKVEVKFPAVDEELTILRNMHQFRDETDLTKKISKVLTVTKLIEFQQLVRQVHIEEHLLKYIATIVHETRMNSSVYLGASPRASIAIMNCAKATAAIKGRDFIVPDDIVEMVPHVLRHRIILTPEREMEGVRTDDVIAQILKKVEVPR